MNKIYSPLENMMGFNPTLYKQKKVTPIFHQFELNNCRYTFKRTEDNQTSFTKDEIPEGKNSSYEWVYIMYGQERCVQKFKEITGQCPFEFKQNS